MNTRDLEFSILSTLLHNTEKRKKIFSIIDDPSFFFLDSQVLTLYTTVQRMESEGLVVDAESLITMCSSVDAEDIKALYTDFGELPVENLERMLSILRRKRVERDLEVVYPDEISSYLKDSNLSFSEKVDKIRETIVDLEVRSAVNITGFQGVSVVVEEYKKDLEERKKKIKHYTSGDHRLDQILTYGFVPKECTTIAGRPSNGKSYYALHLARLLSNVGIPVGIFNLEMRNMSTMDRLTSMSAKLDPVRVIRKTGELTEDETLRLNHELERMKEGLPLYFNDSKSLSLEECEREILALQNRIGQSYMVVIWDLFTKLKDFGEAESAYDIEKICNRFQRMFDRLGIHVIIVLQINREAEKEKMRSISDVSRIYPAPSHIKNSDSFLEISDNLLLVCRPSFYLNRHEWGSFVEPYTRVAIEKQRGPGDPYMGNVLLYKNPPNISGLVEPEPDWDPLKLKFD